MNRRWFGLALLLITFPATAVSQEIDWKTDLDSAKTTASQTGKLVLVHFSADWCRPCKHLKTFVFTSSKVATAIHERVIPVQIDTDLHPELVKQYNVTQIPTDVVITPAGRVVQKRQSPKDISNYVRMMEALDSVDKAMSEERAALAQKIDEILDTGKSNTAKIVDSNSFVPSVPETQQPDPAQEGVLLQAKSDAQARLVKHVTSSDSDAADTETRAQPVASGPQRVINDQFFSEKSNAAENSSPTTTIKEAAELGSSYAAVKMDSSSDETSFVPGKSKATLRPATATIKQATAPADTTDERRSIKAQAMATRPAARTNEFEKPAARSVRPESKMALGGKCPVTLLQDGEWSAGDRKYGCVHRGKTYLFANKAKLTQFQTNPDSFSPILAGYDPVVFHEKGELVDGLVKHGVFMGKAPDQRVVLFNNAETRQQFQTNPRMYMATIRLALKQSDNLK